MLSAETEKQKSVTATTKQLQKLVKGLKGKQRREIELLGLLGSSSSCNLSFSLTHGMASSSFSYVNRAAFIDGTNSKAKKTRAVNTGEKRKI